MLRQGQNTLACRGRYLFSLATPTSREGGMATPMGKPERAKLNAGSITTYRLRRGEIHDTKMISPITYSGAMRKRSVSCSPMSLGMCLAMAGTRLERCPATNSAGKQFRLGVAGSTNTQPVSSNRTRLCSGARPKPFAASDVWVRISYPLCGRATPCCWRGIRVPIVWLSQGAWPKAAAFVLQIGMA